MRKYLIYFMSKKNICPTARLPLVNRQQIYTGIIDKLFRKELGAKRGHGKITAKRLVYYSQKIKKPSISVLKTDVDGLQMAGWIMSVYPEYG